MPAPQSLLSCRLFALTTALVSVLFGLAWRDPVVQNVTLFVRLALYVRIFDVLWLHRSSTYQAVLDRYPITSFDMDVTSRILNGPSEAVKLPGLMARFDWFLSDIQPHLPRWHRLFGATQSLHRKPDPRTVYAYPTKLPEILAASAAGHFGGDVRRALALGGTDTALSEAMGCRNSTGLAELDSDGRTQLASGSASCKHAAAQLRKHFSTILFLGTDVEVDGVSTMPIGLSETWLRQGVAAAAEVAIAGASIDPAAKPKQVLASWGAHNPVELFPAGHPQLRVNCRQASWMSKRLARQWANTSEAIAAGVELRLVPPRDWWAELARYRFLLTPLGDGIQTSRTVEALLVLTVPILRRGPFRTHDDLVEAGWPLIVVEEWGDVTAAALRSWWIGLAPRLQSFRSSCLTAEAYWRLYTGEASRCGE